MRPRLLMCLLLTACSRGPDADLPAIGEARSLAAEWALVNEQQAAGRITATYAATMRKGLRDQLETDLSSLTQPRSRYAGQIRALLLEPDDAAPEALRSRARALKQVEDDLESA